MKANNEFSKHLTSKRALLLFHSPHFYKRISGTGSSHSLSFEFTLAHSRESDFQNDKILTLFYECSLDQSWERLFCETLARLMAGKNILFLQNSTFREIENYLRDENHLPVFDSSVLVLAEESFKRVKNSLLGALLLDKLEGLGTKASVQKNWRSLTLVEKNREVSRLITGFNSLFPTTKPLELALVETSELSVVLNDFPIQLEVLEFLIQSLLGNEEGISSLKLVAVQ